MKVSTNQTKLRIGVMGCASIAKRLMIPAILQLQDNYELIGIASRSEEKALEFAELFNTGAFTGYETLLVQEDIDVVYMPLPTGLHEEWIMKCLDAGKHVLVEKSLAINETSAQRIIDAALSKNLLIMESFMFCYHSQHEVVKDALAENKIGDIRLFRSQFGFPPLDSSNFRYDLSLGGGALLDAGAYTVRASMLFLGSDLEVLSSQLSMNKATKADLYGSAMLVNSRGIVAQLSFGFDNYYQCNYEFWGSVGWLKAYKAFTPKPGEKPQTVLSVNNISVDLPTESDNHFVKILLEMYATIQNQKFEKHYTEILVQSRLLSEIREKARIVWV